MGKGIVDVVELTEILLYTCFAFLTGFLVLTLIPKGKRPEIRCSKKVLLVLVSMIPVLAFGPVLNTIFVLSENLDFWMAFQDIFFTFEIGRAWMYTFLFSFLLAVVVAFRFNGMETQNRFFSGYALFLLLLIALSLGYASHASSIKGMSGFIAHSMHFIGVMVWAGIIGVVAWFSDFSHWKGFLKWFTPTAILCLVILVIGGLFTMEIDIQSYDNWNAFLGSEYIHSWMTNYGQALLIKHLLLIPLVLFAIINGLLHRNQEDKANFQVKLWVRLESVFLLIVFLITAWMGQRTPPHQVNQYLNIEGPSPLFAFVTGTDPVPGSQMSFDFPTTSIIYFALTGLLIGFFISSVRRSRPVPAFICSIGLVILLYAATMSLVQIT